MGIKKWIKKFKKKSTSLSKLVFIESVKDEANKNFKQAEKHLRKFILLLAAYKEIWNINILYPLIQTISFIF
ncbi:hypothetical protein CN391_25885 [Bacillus anthracis]|nr:hypothetical protein CN391_25885 [Bacillus anthracis]